MPYAHCQPRSAARRCVLLWERPAWAAALALLVYSLFAAYHGALWRSHHPYFNYLADAFLHGQLYLRLTPPTVGDLVWFHGRYYLYWSPLPALLLLPFVAIFGVGFPDIPFTLAIAAANVYLVALLLRRASLRRVVRLSRLQRALLVLLFACGTVQVTLAPYGSVWYTSELLGFLCTACAYTAALALSRWRAFLLTGLALAGAVLTRNHLLFAGLWPACYLLHRHRAAGRRRLLAYLLAGVTPVALAILLLAVYDWLRFGNMLDNGLSYHLVNPHLRDDFLKYGVFNLHFVPVNLFYQYIYYPFPPRPTSLIGGSLFWLTPPFMLAFWGAIVGRPRWSVAALAGSMLLVMIPILLLMGTGWLQFGPGYTLDFTVPLLLLTAIGIRRVPLPLMVLLTAIAVLQYAAGTLLLGRHFVN